MKTLEELVKELGLKPRKEEIELGRYGNYVHVFKDNTYTTFEKIMWFADACLTGTTIRSIHQRFDDLETDPKNGRRNIEFSESYASQFDGVSLYDIQRKLGDRYSEEFATQIGIKPEEIFSWLEEQVQKRINHQQLPMHIEA